MGDHRPALVSNFSIFEIKPPQHWTPVPWEFQSKYPGMGTEKPQMKEVKNEKIFDRYFTNRHLRAFYRDRIGFTANLRLSTGNYPNDFQELDAAINGGIGPSLTEYPGGGTLRLKATNQNGQLTPFNMGDGPTDADRGTIWVLQDVKLLGETINDHMTTVYGGFVSFWTMEQVHITIKGICFDGALLAPFAVTICKGATIRGNKIINVHAYLMDYGIAEAYYILISGAAPPFGPITGKVVIKDNEVLASVLDSDLQYNDMEIPVWKNGVDVTYVDAVVLIKNNTIRGHFTNVAVWVWDNSQDTKIQGNYIKTEFPNQTPYEYGDGIFAGKEYTQTGVFLINHNTVICKYPSATGIKLYGYEQEFTNSRVSKNKVTMDGSTSKAITLVNASDNKIIRNKITGSAYYGFRLVGESHDNTFYLGDEDNLEELQAESHIYCGPYTFDNKFIGEDFEDLTIDDQGTNNIFQETDDDDD